MKTAVISPPPPPPPPPEPVNADKSIDWDILVEPSIFWPNNVKVWVPSNEADTNEPLSKENWENDTVSVKENGGFARDTFAVYKEALSDK